VAAYAASKFGLEGWMESLHAEVAPFGITTTVVTPGFFRTELLTEQSTNYAEPSIADYNERRGPLVPSRSRAYRSLGHASSASRRVYSQIGNPAGSYPLPDAQKPSERDRARPTQRQDVAIQSLATRW
jgi:NAD(P)-dependent dehydrogenase (short-subunit alcohol dehydrogenase family)